MAQTPILYRETRLMPTPALPAHLLNIDTSGSSSQRSSLLRAGSKRTFDDISGHDEDSYARKHLATEGSVFFRSKARSSRSFLWRLLDDRKVLEIQAVDLVKERDFENTDSWLTFRLQFGIGILEHGVQFADPEETDALECFVLTESKELVTVTLKRDLLTRANVPAEFDASTCVKRYSSSFLSVRNPYRFVAVSSLQLLISLADGGLARLERKTGENGTQWRETFFSEGGWRGTLTLKGFNPFAGRPTVRYGNIELDPSAVSDMAQSPDGKYVWTVSLDHWLRAWSTTTGRVVLKQDLLNGGDERERHQYVMAAEQGRLLQLVTPPAADDSQALARMDEDAKYSVIVHSPKDHQFKIYEATYTTGVDGEGVHLQDLQSGMRLTPPIEELMDTNIWHLDTFHVQPGVEWSDVQLWIRARSGALCRTFMIEFDLVDSDGTACDLTDIWRTGWTVVDDSSLTIEELKHTADYPGEISISTEVAETPSERWLGFIFYPGRFTTASLETALYMYRKARGLGSTSVGRGFKAAEQPLEERLTSAITSKILLRRLPNDQPDYQRYQQDIQTQWKNFFSVLSHLHTRRHEAIGFAFDAEDGLPVSVCADYVAPVRACNGLELRSSNTYLLYDDLDRGIDEQLLGKIYPQRLRPHGEDETVGESYYLSRLLASARELRQAMSAAANAKLRTAARRSALDPNGGNNDPGLAAALFDECNMQDEITDDAFEALNAGVEGLGGLTSLNDEVLLALIEWLNDETLVTGRSDGRFLGRYGVGFNVQVATEKLMQAEGILFDVLALIAFMAGGLEDELHEDFDPDGMHATAVIWLRRNQLLLWMAGHVREKTTNIADAPRQGEQAVELTETVTLLEDIFIGDWDALEPQQDDISGLPGLLTLWATKWVQGPAIAGEDAWAGTTTHILSRLVKAKEVDLATDFLRFTNRSLSWSVYVQARLRVLTGGYAHASLDFQDAAENMAAGKLNDTARLISLDEEVGFGNGFAAYFQHVLELFEKLKAYSYVADFARLALDHTERIKDLARSMAELDKRKGQDSPALERIDAASEEARLLQVVKTRDDILNRLFNALVLTGRFSEAYEALAQIHNLPVRRSGLRKLIETCVKQEAVPTLLELPFKGDMANDADKAIQDFAKRELASGSSSTATPYYQILYAFRTQRSDFRGAASILYEHLERVRHSPNGSRDPEDETLLNCYLLLINTLACCGEDDAWVLAEPINGVHGEGAKRKLVRLEDVRREYARELDRRSEAVLGRFPVVGGGDAMDVL